LRQRGCLFVVPVLVSAAILFAAETPIPPSPARWVTDTTNFLPAEALRALDARLSAYEQGTGHQLLVYIGATTGDAPIEDWAVRAFQQWKVGRKGLDDGLVLFIMSQDHKLRIEVGYGLESVVPDAVASRVINEVIAPRVQAGDPAGAVTAGVDSLIGTIGEQSPALPPARTRVQAKPVSVGQWIFYGIVGILLLAFAITHPSLALFFLANILSGGGRQGGGGGFGGGGFSGGGGRSGGGGASGSW
jgi:uncharacterized protein